MSIKSIVAGVVGVVVCASAVANPSDCNQNGIIDGDEIASGRSFDANTNGVPDSCETSMAPPVIRAIGINRGPTCGFWTTGTLTGVWDLFVSRTPQVGSWMNGGSAAGATVDLWAELSPGINTFHIWHDDNYCSSPVFGLGIWFPTDVTPRISISPGNPCLPYSGLLNSAIASSTDVAGSGSASAEIGLWTVRVLSYVVSSGADAVGPESVGQDGSPDIRTTIELEVIFNDADRDGIPNSLDNCPTIANPDQLDCNNNGVGEACETFPDCNSNSVPDSCDIASGTSADADSNGVPDSCQPDCNLNGLPDGFDIASGLISDLNADGTPDDCQGASMIRRVSPNLGAPSGATARVWIVPELLPSESNVTITVDLRGDLNGNSEWADVVLNNGKPRRFFQSDGGICPELPDHAEIVLSRDEWNALVGTDGLLTVRVECPPTVDGSECKDQGLTLLSLAYVGVTPAGDCDGNQRLDVAETYDGSAPDCNSNMVPDRCDIAGGTSQDCNANEVPDACELTATPSIDCDRNGSIDSCDLVTGGTSVDCDQNGRIDSCQVSETPGTDCNGNLRPDPCDIASGTSADVDRNGTPDDCQTISVPDQYDGIQAAIDAAPATEMRIISVAPGTYAGPINLLGKPIRLVGTGGAAVTTISGTGGQSQSVVRAISGEPAISLIKGFTIRGGVTGSPLPSLPSANCGGGLLVFNSQTGIQDCTFTDNVSSFGGGAYLLGHVGSITNCTFATNIAQGYGGGLQLFDSSTAISGCSFTDNVAVTAGAGLHMVSNTPTLVNCTITGNDCNDQGGGISWDPVNPGSVMTLQGTTVTGNIADVIGGGLYVYPSGVAAETQLVGTTVCGNSVRNISGPYQADVTSQVCDCRADLSADGFVNGVDLAIVLSNWGVVGSSADLTGDDTVDGADLGIILAAWGTCPSS